MPRLTPVPGVPDYVLGVMNLRGNIVPVMSLERRFGHDERRPADSYRVVIVLRERGPGSVRLAGVAVDAVTEVLDLPPDRLGAPPTRRGEARLDEDRVHGGEDLAMAAGFVEAVAMLDARLLVVLNTDATAFAAVPAMVTRSAIG